MARCLSVRLSHADIGSKRLNIFSNFSTIMVAPPYFFRTKRYDNIPAGTPPLMGASNAQCIKNCDFRPLFGFISESIQDRAIVIMKHQKELVRDLSNGAISNKLE